MTEDAPKSGTQLSTVGMQKAGAGAMLVPESLKDAVYFAEVMSRADIALPAHLRGNTGACLAVAMQAFRWEFDPFMVANKTYLVNGRIAYEAQLVASVVITRAPIQSRPDYSYSGEGQTRRCKVVITMKDGQKLEYESPTFKDILTKNSPLWKADLDQQLGYFAIRSWARRHTPEVLMGVYTPDEVEVMRDVTPRETGLSAKLSGQRIDMASGQAVNVQGFAVDNVERAMDADFVDVSHDAQGAQPQTLDEVLQGDDIPAEVRGADNPEAPDSMQVPMHDLIPDERVAWVEAFKALSLKQVGPTALMALWTSYYERQIKPLYEVDERLYGHLEKWFEERLKKARAAEAKA